jgi:hypothetical protein
MENKTNALKSTTLTNKNTEEKSYSKPLNKKLKIQLIPFSFL